PTARDFDDVDYFPVAQINRRVLRIPTNARLTASRQVAELSRKLNVLVDPDEPVCGRAGSVIAHSVDEEAPGAVGECATVLPNVQFLTVAFLPGVVFLEIERLGLKRALVQHFNQTFFCPLPQSP